MMLQASASRSKGSWRTVDLGRRGHPLRILKSPRMHPAESV